jgi:response regulator RpfG family c-di-GMP phosphodiesterase/serine/threonine protein kinase
VFPAPPERREEAPCAETTHAIDTPRPAAVDRNPGYSVRGASVPVLSNPDLKWPALGDRNCPPVQIVLRRLLDSSLIPPEDWDQLPDGTRADMSRCTDPEALLPLLIEHGLLTPYQAQCVNTGRAENLLLGNYRVLDRLGSGGMGVVFKAEHIHLRRPVAVKVLPLGASLDPRLDQRFLREVRLLAQLQHPHIVAAIDAGTLSAGDPPMPVLRYFVMEFVPGQDLEELVKEKGFLPVARACELVYQTASALAEADRHHLVHRDVKPSNIRVTPDGRAKLLDFGLARQTLSRITEPGTLLGSMDYIAPEQACDAGTVDIRADIYGLGGTLFWCLTAQPPFGARDSLLQQVASRLTQAAPSVRAYRPEVPEELEAVVARMLATQPADRFLSPRAVMQALLPFRRPETHESILLSAPATGSCGEDSVPGADMPRGNQVLLVTDDDAVAAFCRDNLQGAGFVCDAQANGLLALEAARVKPYVLVIVDLDGLNVEVPLFCRKMRRLPHCPNLKIVLVSGDMAAEDLTRLLLEGADEVLPKPAQAATWAARIKAVLRLKEAQDRGDWVNRHLITTNQKLKQKLTSRDGDLVRARHAMVMGLAQLVRYRENASDAHLLRLERYCRCLAEEAAKLPDFADQIHADFIDLLCCCAPLHDIGKVGLPDYILMKPGKLEPEERIIMQSHTITGADLLKAIARQQGSPLAFVKMAPEIARHHHERFDGTGYPDGLGGRDIPLAARLVAVADVYDALRSRRVYKPALPHAASVQVIQKGSGEQFDPAFVRAFEGCAAQFDQIYRELPD